TFSRTQFPNGHRCEDFAALGNRSDAGSEDHRLAEEVAFILNRLASVQADAHTQGLRGRFVAVGECPLKGERAFNGARNGRERGHEAVADSLDLSAAMLPQG